MADNEYFRVYSGYTLDFLDANEAYPLPDGGQWPEGTVIPTFSYVNGFNLYYPFSGVIGTKESSSSSTNYFNTYFFEADETAERYYINDMVAQDPVTNARWNRNNQVAVTQKTFNRLVKDLWFRPTTDNKSVSLIDVNRDYITNKNTVLTYLSSPNTTIDFVETGEIPLDKPSFNCFELNYNYPALGNKVILNESVKNVKRYLPIYKSGWQESFGAWFYISPFFNYSNYDVRQNTPSDSQVQNENSHNYCNIWNNYIDIPNEFDMSKIYFNTMGCYNYWDGANKMFGVSLKVVGHRVYFKYWNRDVGRIYGHYTAKYIPIPVVNPNYDWDQVVERGDGQGWTIRLVDWYDIGSHQAIIRIAYFP